MPRPSSAFESPGVLTPPEAAARIVSEIHPLPVICIPLLDALDCVLANEVRSPIDLPAWDNSAMDGYAVRSVDFEPAGGAAEPGKAAKKAKAPEAVVLRVVEYVPAGKFPTRALGPGECTRIFTGAPLPQGADGVIRQEDTTPLDGDRVRIDQTRDLGKNLRRQGEDIQKHSVVLARGTPLGPAQLGVLASVGESEAYVYRRPRVAFFGSGDEIAELDEREEILQGRKIASSNTYTLQAMIRRAGAEPVNLGLAKDDLDDLRYRVHAAFTSDLLVTSAGVSVGEHDYVRKVLDEVKVTPKFWKIAMRPGAPVGFGIIGALPWIGLPGNPVSTMVTFELFVRPAIRKMLGHTELFRRTVPVTVGEAVSLGPRLRHFLRAIVSEEDGKRVARLTGPQGSGILTSMAKANALLIVPEDRPVVHEGETLTAIMLEDPVHTREPMF